MTVTTGENNLTLLVEMETFNRLEKQATFAQVIPEPPFSRLDTPEADNLRYRAAGRRRGHQPSPAGTQPIWRSAFGAPFYCTRAALWPRGGCEAPGNI